MWSSTRVTSTYRMKGHLGTQDKNAGAKNGAHPSKASMKIGTASSDEGGLTDKKQHPCREHSTM